MNNAILAAGAAPEEVTSALERGERLLWLGGPRQGLRLRGADVFLIPFSLLWAGFAIFWESSVLAIPNSPFFMKLWGIPFVLIGLYFVAGRFFADAKMRDTTVYAVTNQRALIFSGIFRRETKSLTLRNVPEVSVVKARDGSGTISFGSVPPFAAFSSGFAGWPGYGRNLPPQFDMIDDVAQVATLLRDTQRSASA